MKRYWQSKRFRLLVAVVAALTCTLAAGAAWDTYKVARMTEKMKTVCVGRMLIDLPDEARVELYGARIDGFVVEAFAESPEAFKTRVAAREAEIRAKPDRLGASNNMESARDVRTDTGLAGKIFVHGRNVTEGSAAKGLELERYHYEGVALEAHVHANGISIDVTADDYDPGRAGNLARLVGQLIANPANSIPSEPGFCIDRAYVRDPLKAEQGEQVTMAAKLPSHLDIGINFDTIAGAKPDAQGLLERNDESHARAPVAVNMRFTRLRAAPRTIGGLTGDELVERVIEENFVLVYGFQWEMNGTVDDVLTPALSLIMATGRGDEGPISSSLSQHAAVSLWDRISSSIRTRPAAAPNTSMTAAAAPLGTQASAGDTCPQSGWWECSNGGDGISVHGGQRQYIREGERMPQALLLPRQTLWEKVRGLQPSFEDKDPTSWKLVDKRSRRRITPSVQLAQAAGAPAAATAAATGGAIERASVGIYAITGNPCPASGWWHCQESDALDGTRWFAQGSLLPAATFVVPGRVFGRTTGTPTAIQRRGTWQLVRLARVAEGAGGRDPGDGHAGPGDSAEQGQT